MVKAVWPTVIISTFTNETFRINARIGSRIGSLCIQILQIR